MGGLCVCVCMRVCVLCALHVFLLLCDRQFLLALCQVHPSCQAQSRYPFTQAFCLVLADVFFLARCFECAEPRAAPGAVVFFLAHCFVLAEPRAVPGAVVFFLAR